jgi:hypothetical protein
MRGARAVMDFLVATLALRRRIRTPGPVAVAMVGERWF